MAEKWKPIPYMLKAVKWLLERHAAALFLDPGLRKTSITLAALKVLRNEGLLKGAVVLAPLRACQLVWPAEVLKWLEFNDLDMVVLHGKNKDKLVKEKHDIYVLNYEGLPWFINGGHLRNLFKRGWMDTLIFDELSKMKNKRRKAPKNSRYKLLEPWLGKFTRRWGLTGSPAANGLMNLFGQVYALDLGKAFGPYITYFRNAFFTPKGPWTWVLQEGADKLIYDRVKPLALRMAADDYLQLPKIIPHTVKYDLPPNVREMYDELEQEMLVLMDSGEPITAPNAATLKNKLRQVAGGAIYRNLVHPVTGERLRTKNDAWIHLHDEKLDALEEYVEELQGQQVLIGYEYKHDLERLQARFGKDTPYIGGGVTAKRAVWIEKEWNAGNLEILLGQPQSMGHALNFQDSNANHVAWFGLPWDFELYDQFIRRLLRSGNMAASMFVTAFVGRDTAEEDVAWCLRRKDATQQKLFAALETGIRARMGGGLAKVRRAVAASVAPVKVPRRAAPARAKPAATAAKAIAGRVKRAGARG